jgi:hypothetical protein
MAEEGGFIYLFLFYFIFGGNLGRLADKISCVFYILNFPFEKTELSNRWFELQIFKTL